MSNNLLDKIPDIKKAGSNFKLLIENEGLIPARRVINTIPQDFINKDGNFRKQFQTTEFNQRLWELFLYKLFNETGFQLIDSEHEYPDFEIEKNGQKIFVEAVSTNPTDNDSISPLLLKGLKSNLFESIKAFISIQLLNQYSLKISNALYSKLQKEYWTNPWVEGFPLVIAINAFHNPYTSMIPDSKIIEYLYKKKLKIKTNAAGNQKSEYSQTGDIEFDNRKKPSGFFELPNSENISAVIFYNERPLWKFNRMGYLDTDSATSLMSRYGFKFDSTPGALKPKEYSYIVNNENHVEEWKEGVSIFHNPNAKEPLDKEVFDGYRQIWIGENGDYEGFTPEFFPFTSQTIMITNE